MQVKDLILQIRMSLNDAQGLRTSDYQIMNAINEAVTQLFDSLIGFANGLARKIATLPVTDGVAELPEDFHSVSLISGSDGVLYPDYGNILPESGCYKVVGNELLVTDESSVDMEYFYMPEPVTTVEDVLEIQRSLRSVLVAVASGLLRGERDKVGMTIYQTVSSMASRGVAHLPDVKIFQ